jgi:hypothetical protein
LFIWILFSSYAGFLPLYGAIRRLKDWHNAAVISLSKGGNVDISDQTSSESDNYIGSYKSNYHTITTMTAPIFMAIYITYICIFIKPLNN